MSKTIKVYCEGKAGSHDFDVLEKVIDGLNIQIKPIGGKRGAKSAIQVYESILMKSDFKIFFRDRDFDAPVPNEEKLHFDKSYVYYSYRTTIENYLLDYSLIEKYSIGKSWYSRNLRNDYHEAAKSIKFFQAVRHTLGELRLPTDFGTNIVSSSGTLPEKLSDSYCREIGYDKVLGVSNATAEQWSRKSYDDVFDKYVGLFSDRFIEEDTFLIYFQGKDFMKALCKKLSGFSPRDYYKYAKANFDYQKFGDLVQLRSILESALR